MLSLNTKLRWFDLILTAWLSMLAGAAVVITGFAFGTILPVSHTRLVRVYTCIRCPTTPVSPMAVAVTAYTNHQCETDSTPHHTATMTGPIPGWTCAVSRDLIHWLGGRVYIPGIGVRRVNDLMHARYTRALDLYVGDGRRARRHAKQFGRQEHQVVFLGR